MGVWIEDLADEDHDLKVNWWNWRVILRIIEAMGLIDNERIEMMGYNFTGVKVSKEESRQIAAHLRDRLSNMNPGERILWDLSKTSEPDSGVFHEDPSDDYSALYHVLKDFSEFLDECDGFTVS